MMRQYVKTCLMVLCLALSIPMMQPGTLANLKIQTSAQADDTTVEVFSQEEKKDLLQKLSTASEFPLTVTNPIGSGVEIADAYVKAVSRDPHYVSANEISKIYVTDHVMQLRFTLRNTTTHIMTGFDVRFTSQQTSPGWSLSRSQVDIAPGASYPFRINFMAIAGNPMNLMVEITQINFWQAPTWKANSVAANTWNHRPKNPEVDTKPQPQNLLRPQYTDLARANKVTGGVGLFLYVGTDGMVKKVEVIRPLPDGLTEEAIKVARVLQFRPAMRNGVPVEYTVAIEISYNLR